MEQLTKDLLQIMNSRYNTQYNYDWFEHLDRISPSFYPFNKIEIIMSRLLATGTIGWDYYLKMRSDYMARNPNLYLYEMTAPRIFGETWAQGWLNELVPDLKKPSREYDNNYSNGQYDFWYKGIRIEVKASRAVRNESGGTLISKAISSTSLSDFDMNFQQLKTYCCDVFVWIGVWTDLMRCWVLSSREVSDMNPSGQHRGNSEEGQIHITKYNINNFTQYEITNRNQILPKIIEKSRLNDY